MGYLKSRRGQLSVAGFLFASLLLRIFPGIDISISRLFFDGAFHSDNRWWAILLQQGIKYFLVLSMATVIGVYMYNRRSRRSVWAIDGRKVSYLCLVLIIGAGLIVNVTFKDNFGRARPRDVAEFGGTRQFTPAFTISHECIKNCSFSSGEAAAGFFSLALISALRRRRGLFIAGLALGAAVSVSRLAVGAHFFSDIVVSFFVMWILSDVLHHYMLIRVPAPGCVTAPAIPSRS